MCNFEEQPMLGLDENFCRLDSFPALLVIAAFHDERDNCQGRWP